jgi:hypothetical protein
VEAFDENDSLGLFENRDAALRAIGSKLKSDNASE